MDELNKLSVELENGVLEFVRLINENEARDYWTSMITALFEENVVYTISEVQQTLILGRKPLQESLRKLCLRYHDNVHQNIMNSSTWIDSKKWFNTDTKRFLFFTKLITEWNCEIIININK